MLISLSLSHSPSVILFLCMPCQTYVVPQGALFGSVTGNPDILFNNIRIYGTILLILLSIIVFVGVKLVSLSLSLSLSILLPTYTHNCSYICHG